MDEKTLLAKVDHTLLSTTATENDIKGLIDDAIYYETASVCIPPCYVRFAKDYAKSKMKVCTVIGFPNGYSTAEAKYIETKDAVLNGADEIDMVINVCNVKNAYFDKVLKEIKLVRTACPGKILKVIIETCLLTEDEKIKLCEIVSKSGADYIKTSTGFSTGGATFEDVKIFKAHISPNLKIKAAGGISSLEDAYKFIELGADRLGTSRVVKIIKQRDEKN